MLKPPIFSIPSGSTDSFQEQDYDYEVDEKTDLRDFGIDGGAVSSSSSNNSSPIFDARDVAPPPPRSSSPSAASTVRQHPRAFTDCSSPASELTAVAEEARLKANVRRYYALMELFETERGYLNDLRVLVEVYLASLGAVHPPTAIPSQLNASSRALQSQSQSQSQCPADSRHPRRLSPHGLPQICNVSPIGSYEHIASAVPQPVLLTEEPPLPPLPPMEKILPPTPPPQELATDGEPSSSSSSSLVSDGGVGMRTSNPKRMSPLHPPSAFPSQGLLDGVVGGELIAVGSASLKQVQQRSRKRSLSVTLGLGGRSSSSSSDEGASVVLPPPNAIGGHRRSSSSTSVRTEQQHRHQNEHHQLTYISSTSAHGSTFVSNSFTASTSSCSHASTTVSTSSVTASSSTPLSSATSSPVTPCIPIHPHPSSLTTSNANSGSSSNKIPLLTPAEKEIMARSACALLALHERLVEGLDGILRNCGGAGTGLGSENVEEAVRAVCEVFVKEATNFSPYSSFCAGHTEALDTARRAMRSHSNDWNEWEKRCAMDACDLILPSTPNPQDGVCSSEPESENNQHALTKLQKLARRSSTLLLGGSHQGQVTDVVASSSSTTLTLRRRHSASASTLSLGGMAASDSGASVRGGLKHTKSEPKKRESVSSLAATVSMRVDGVEEIAASPNRKPKRLSMGLPSTLSIASQATGVEGTPRSATEKERHAMRKLVFADYLIKPVQRVCKYPLLIEQLRVPGMDTNGAVAEALKAMREVATAVDEARRRRDIEIKSRLIVDRLIAGNPSSSNSGGHQAHQVPTADEVLSSSTGGNGHGDAEGEAESEAGPSKAQPSRTMSLSAAFTRSRSRVSIHQGETTPIITHKRSRSWQQQQQQASRDAPSGGLKANVLVPGAPSRAFLTSLGACLLAGTLDVVVCDHNEPHAAKMCRDIRRDSMLSVSSGLSTLGGRTSPTVNTMHFQDVEEQEERSISLPPPPVQQHAQASRDPVKVKYLVAFLYVGGYVVMAKPLKAGVYAARHWFALADDMVDVLDVGEDEALLPCSFHLHFRSTGHRLELAAACQREKQLWLEAIQNARSVRPTWEFEPLPTLSLSAAVISTRSRTSVDLQPPPPPIPAVPSVPSTLDEAAMRPVLPTRKESSSTIKTDATIKQRHPNTTPNRRASTMSASASVRSFFLSNGPLAYGVSENSSAGPSTVLIRRASATRRAQADRILVDVLSEPLLEARIRAKACNEVLFRDPDPPQNTALGVSAMAKNRLMGRESVLVSKQCQQFPSLPSPLDRQAFTVESSSNGTVQRRTSLMARAISMTGKRARTLAPKKGNGMRLIVATSRPNIPINGDYTQSSSMHSPISPESPPPAPSPSPEPMSRSQCSSVSTSAPDHSPVDTHFPPEVRVVGIDSPPRYVHELPDILEQESRPRRTKSLVDNVKGFFMPRSTSPSPSATSSASSRNPSVEPSGSDKTNEKQRAPVLSRLLRSTSLLQRSRTSSDVTEEARPASSAESRPTSLARLATEPILTHSASPSYSKYPAMPSANSSSNLLSPPAGAGCFDVDPTTVPLPPDTTGFPLSSSSSRTSDPAKDKKKTLGRSLKKRFFSSSLAPLTPMTLPHTQAV